MANSFPFKEKGEFIYLFPKLQLQSFFLSYRRMNKVCNSYLPAHLTEQFILITALSTLVIS